jgi:hypothetical protein
MPQRKNVEPKLGKVMFSARLDVDIVEALRSLAAVDRRSMTAQLSWLVMEERTRRKGARRGGSAAV